MDTEKNSTNTDGVRENEAPSGPQEAQDSPKPNEPCEAQESKEVSALSSEQDGEQTPPDASGKSRKKAKGSFIASVYDVAEMFAICATVVLLIFTFIARLTVVEGTSMVQTLHEGEFMLVRSLGYKPERGDIVVIDDPTAGPYAHPLIKRVIALGGDTLDIDFETWTVTVNGEVIDESEYLYLDPTRILTAEYEFPITIKEGHVFVMGDNRHNSADSRIRVIGQIDERCVVGKAAIRVLPFSKLKYFG